jgi:hypothetical protein
LNMETKPGSKTWYMQVFILSGHNEKLCNLCALPKCYSGVQIKEDVKGRACSTGGRDENCIKYFGWKT